MSGNVSLYNETDGAGILPTPTIGAIGLIENLDDLIGGLESARRSLLQTAFNDGETGLQQFFGLGAFVGASQDYNRAVDALIRKFSDGKISASELLTAIDEVNQTFDDSSANTLNGADGPPM